MKPFALPVVWQSRPSLVLTLIALGLAIATRPMHGQTISFLRQLGVSRVYGRSPAADASGVYVFGTERYTKYDSGGNELWTREFSPPEGGRVTLISAAAADSAVYLVGTIYPSAAFVRSIAFVRKYDAYGNELWTRQIAEPFPLYWAAGVATDATGVYVGGVYSSERGTCECLGDAFVRKFSADGAELWTRQTQRRWDDPMWDVVEGVAVDATGVYVVGIVGQDWPYDSASGFMRKYNADGAELWARNFGQFESYVSGGYTAVTADGSNVYVAVSDSSRHDFVLRKYDAGGNELWTREVATSHSVFASAVTGDGTGLYVVGTTHGALPGQCRSGSSSDAFVRKYDADGAELWTREFGRSYSASADGVAVDATGVYAVGQASDAPGAGGLVFLAKLEKDVVGVTESKPRILPDCVINAASYVGGGVAAGEIVTILGSAMGPAELVPLRLTEDRKLATALADTRILFNGVPAPLMYVSDKQSSAIVPYAVAGQPSVDVQVEYQGVRSDVMTVPVLASRPGIFTVDNSGQGEAAIVNEDGSTNSPLNPAQRGSIVTISATGGGEIDPGVLDGQILGEVLPRTDLPVSAWFDNGSKKWGDCFYQQVKCSENGSEGEVLYAGGVSGSVAGLVQLRVRVPLNALASNAVQFGLEIGSQWAGQQLAIALR
jgi:uncharacterized protein (TIGR03437 family)